MRVPRFLLSHPTPFPKDSAELTNVTIQLDREESHHLAKVLRLAIGSPLEIYEVLSSRNFRGEYLGLEKDLASVRLQAETSNAYFKPKIHLLIAVASNEACDFIVEKASELGASSLTFFFGERSQRGSRIEKVRARVPRFERIALTALKQSGSPRPPAITIENTLAEAISKIQPPEAMRFIALAPRPDPQSIEITNLFSALLGQSARTGVQLEKVSKNADFLVLIGPEGGWSDEEVSASLERGFSPISLGPTTMRTETAMLAALAIITAFSSQ